jgi:L-ascorbate metabolism protein UlaG (beta-lactamase superfamily)
MEISWFGHSCFQVRGKQVTLVTDPFSERQASQESLARLNKVNAAIVTVSHDHSGHNQVAAVGGSPRVVKGPGEYEISDVLITGVASYHDAKRGSERGRNTIYLIHMDDLVLCHLGDLGHGLQDEQLEAVADVDVLFVPIGGQSTLNPTQAAEVISQIEPRVIIPMHYPTSEVEGEFSEPLRKFCREMQVESPTVLPKLSITRNSLPTEIQVVLLSPVIP